MITDQRLAPEPIDVCGLPVHPLTLAGSVDAAVRLIEDDTPHQHVVINAAKVVQARRDPELARIIRSCSLINADGQSIVWASRILGRPLPERVAGIDLMHALWETAAGRGHRVYLLGATSQVVAKAANLAAERGVNVVGHRDGYWKPAEEREVVAEIRRARVDLLFVGIPSPRKEFFFAQHLAELDVGLAFGVGGSFDVIAGLRQRAPMWMQRAGLEWIYRLLQEPRRMFMRYLVGNTRFAAIVWREWSAQRRRNPRKVNSRSDRAA